jgi:hypothetical protein
MKDETLLRNSHMFIMRIWVAQEDEAGDEEQGEEAKGDVGQIAIRGKVQHILGEEIHSFRNWASLVNAIQGMLTPPAQGPDAKTPSAHK